MTFLTPIRYLMCLCFAFADIGTPNRTPGAIVEYDFLRSDCLKGAFHHSNSSSAVHRIVNVAGSCLDYNGLSGKQSNPTAAPSLAPAARSAAPLTNLLSALKSSPAITFAFWILPPPSLPKKVGLSSLISFEYDPTQVLCGSSLAVLENSKTGSRQSASSICQNVLTTTQLVEGTTYADSSEVSSMRYVVATFQFSEQMYPGLGSVSTVVTNSSHDAIRSSFVTQKGHSIGKGSMHPSYFQALSDPHLTLLSGSGGSRWQGQLLQLSIYPRLLTDREVETNHLAGLSNSLPLSWNRTVRVREDVLSNISLPVLDADNQRWHANFFLHCAGGVSSAGVCSKMRVRLVRTPSHGVLVGSDSKVLALGDVIEFSPGSGGGGGNLRASSVEGNSDYVVHYQAFLNQHSTSNSSIFDSFDIVAEDGWTADVSGVSTVSLIVLAVNDAPVAVNSSALLFTRQCIVLPTLRGTDAADWTGENASRTDFSVLKAVVVALPSNGTLHQVWPNGTLHSDAITEPPARGTDLLNPFTVGYCHSGDELVLLDSPTRPGVVLAGTDSFLFAVVDALGVSSASAAIQLEVLPRIEGAVSSFTALMPLEGTMSPLTLLGRVLYDDAASRVVGSSAEEFMTIRIVVPPRNGTLYDLVTGQELTAGSVVLSSSMLPVPGSAVLFNLTVGYKANDDFFTQPHLTWSGDPLLRSVEPDKLSFAVVKVSVATSRTVATSCPVEQSIEVRNKNNPTDITFKFNDPADSAKGYFELYAISNTGANKRRARHRQRRLDARLPWKSGGGASSKVSRGGSSSSSVIESVKSEADVNALGSHIVMDNSFTLADVDLGVDLIRARVISSTALGLLSLNPEHVGGVDFNSATYCFLSTSSSGMCVGDGYHNNEMSFLGTPENIMRALNGLQYMSAMENHIDWVNITLFDGAGATEGCLEEKTMLKGGQRGGEASYRDACFVRAVSIEVRVRGFYDDVVGADDDGGGVGGDGGQGLSSSVWVTRGMQACVILVAGTVLYCLVKCVCGPCVQRFKKQQKSKSAASLSLEQVGGKSRRQEAVWTASRRAAGGEDEEEKEGDSSLYDNNFDGACENDCDIQLTNNVHDDMDKQHDEKDGLGNNCV